MTYNQKIILYLSFVVMLLSVTSGSFLLNLKEDNAIQKKASQHYLSAGIRSMLVVEPSVEQNEDRVITQEVYQPIRLERAVFKPYVVLKDKTKSGSSKENYSPALILYEDEVVIEFTKKMATSRNIKRAIVRVLLSKHPQSEKNLLVKASFNLKETPYFYKKIVDQNNLPIRYPKQAYDYANFILENMLEDFSDVEGDFVLVHIPLIQSNLKGAARYYQDAVENYSAEYNISPSLVYAVMEVESNFNPQALSGSNAIGLMQLKANAAGKDVHNLVDQKLGKPSNSELFDSENNIRMGAAYLGLLNHDYLGKVKNKEIKEMMSISSYNGGLSTVLNLFGRTPERAILKVNKMKPKQVYNKLRFEHKSKETRLYLDKVLKANSKYKQQLNLPLERF